MTTHQFTPKVGDDEPVFILVGRDPQAWQAVEHWAGLREQAIKEGTKPESDMAKVVEAREQAAIMHEYAMKHQQMQMQQEDQPLPRRQPK